MKTKVTILLLLDLSAAFDTLDHDILIDRLSTFLNLSDSALNWFKSYLSDRTQSVITEKGLSNPRPVPYGVPQGSVDGPQLFRIYILPLLLLLQKLGFAIHCFADDTQIYISFIPNDFNEF